MNRALPMSEGQAADSRFGDCTREIQRFTGLPPASCEHLVIAYCSQSLIGMVMRVGTHDFPVCYAGIIPAYTSSSIAALQFAAAIIEKAKENTRAAKLAVLHSSSLNDPNLTYGGDVAVIGTCGPLRARMSGKHNTQAMDRFAAIVRGQRQPGVRSPHLCALWAMRPDDFVDAMESGNSVAFERIMSIVPVGECEVPEAIPESVDGLAITDALMRGCRCRSRVGNVIRADDRATSAILNAAEGTPFWGDTQRCIMTGAAAIYLASHDDDDEMCIDHDCARRSIEMYREAERAKAELFASKNGNKENFLQGAKIERESAALLGYINRNGICEMSPRDVVGHGLADSVVHAKLLLVILERLGMAVQQMYIFNGRPLQKWIFSSCPRSTDAKADQVLISGGT